MKSFSSVNVMAEFLNVQQGSKFSKLTSFISKQLPVSLKIKVPNRIFLRSELICETIEEETGERFTQSDLVFILFQEQIDNYSLNPNPLKILRILKQTDSSFFVTRYYENGEDKLVPLKVSISKRDLLKLEMMLQDCQDCEKSDIGFTVERLLELQYMSFNQSIITGQREDAIQNIIKLVEGE